MKSNDLKRKKDEIILKAEGITKKFPGTLALNNVDFEVLKGKVHALVGENGAGKSTLIKILGGVHQPTEGKLYYHNSALKLSTPKEAIDKKIVTIHQEFSLAQTLTAAENIFLGQYPMGLMGSINNKELNKKTKILFNKLGIEINLNVPVSKLSVAKQQMVEIAKALSKQAEVLILDEPTAVLDRENTIKLFDLLKLLKSEGIGIVYISHRLEEIFQIADDVTVLRDGELTGKSLVSKIDENWLIQKMIGRESLINKKSESKKFGKKVLEVKNLSYNNEFENISFSIKEGEVLTLAGLVGAGRTEVAKSICGIEALDEGEIKLLGSRVNISSPVDAIEKGIMYLPENRGEEGLFLNLSVMENINISNLSEFFSFPSLNQKKEIKKVNKLVSSLKIKTPDINTLIKTLSGGNQQKAILARLLGRKNNLIILDEPTRGVDIGAKEDIYDVISELSKEGLAILLISSEMEEVIQLSDKVVVLKKGKIATKLEKEEISEENIMKAAIN